MTPVEIIGIVVLALLGIGLGYVLPGKKRISPIANKRKIEEAQQSALHIKQEAKERVSRMRELLASDEKDFAEQKKHMEENLKQKEEIMKRREDRNKSYEQSLKSFQSEVTKLQSQTKGTREKMIDALAKASKLSPEKAREHLEKELKDVITGNKKAREKAFLEEMEEQAAQEAKAVLRPIIQRLVIKSSVDKNNTTITIKDDKFKGLLIGKNGQNVAYLESLLPVAIIFNLNPNTIHVGGVNLLRRHIAKGAINRLQKRVKKKGTITHEMIDKVVAESEKEIMGICDRKGAEAMKKMGIDPKPLDNELINYIGRMYFRTSFGQNILGHSLEMAYLARLIAEQIGADANVAMQAAFYHDIGKAIDHDVGGAHDDLSKEILEKHNFDPAIVYAAFAHHDKVPCESPADFIVKAVDAISAVRPGARQESVTNYFERIKQLEDTAKSFAGIRKVFTMSAGREVRVMVDEKQINDGQMQGIADGIAEKISEDLSFPGIIKVNLIRKTKATDVARDKR